MLECTCDYETRSKLSLEKSGAIVYAKHPSTSIFCMSYKIGDGPTLLWIPERSPMPKDLWRCFRHGKVSAWNASFERAITRWTLTRYQTLTKEQREWFTIMPPSSWRCDAAKAAACSLPRKLEIAAKVLGLKTQKDMVGNRLIKKYAKPRKPSKNNPKLWWDDKEELRRIYSYCIDDTEAEYEADQSLPDLTAYEQRVWELDQLINDRGILIDIPTVKTILQMIDEEMGNITREVQKLTKGKISSATKVAQVLKWVNKRGADMSNLQAATIRDKLLEDDLNDDVRQMLELRQASSKTSTKKYIAMLHAVDSDNRARELLLYCGTVPTARWAGRRVQPQNFPRGNLKIEDINKIIGVING